MPLLVNIKKLSRISDMTVEFKWINIYISLLMLAAS